MNILLISPNTLTVPYPVYPLGLDYVAGAVGTEHEVRIVDMNVTDSDALEGILVEFAPDIIGISCRNIDNTEAGEPRFFINRYRQLVAWLRQRSMAILVCGGSGFTIMPEQVLAALGADYGIIGEGERFGLLVAALARGEDGKGIPGVMAAQDRGTVPPPWQGGQRRRFGAPFFHYNFYLERGGMLNLQSKRGCCFRCIYCPYPHIEGKKQRLVPPEAVARIARDLEAAGAKYLFVTDSAFNSDVDHSLDVARAFRRAGVSIPWGGFFAPIRVPADYFAIMADAGLKHVEFGTESLSAAMLTSYRKPFVPEDVLAAHGQARRAGLHTAHYFLFGGPGESEATITQTLDTVEVLDKAALFFFIGIRIYPQTALYDIALKEGKITRATDLLKPVFYSADGIDRAAIEAMVTVRAAGRINWIIGSGGIRSAQIVSRMHERGYIGPLWEYLIR